MKRKDIVDSSANVVESIGKVNNYYTSGNSSYKVTEETDDYIITNDGREPFLLVGKVVYPLNWNMLDDFTESDFRGILKHWRDISLFNL